MNMKKIDGDGALLNLTGLKGMRKDLDNCTIVFTFEKTDGIKDYKEYVHKYGSLAKMNQWFAMISKDLTA